jgi:hypothetical protein
MAIFERDPMASMAIFINHSSEDNFPFRVSELQFGFIVKSARKLLVIPTESATEGISGQTPSPLHSHSGLAYGL